MTFEDSAPPAPAVPALRRSGILLHPTSLPGPHGSGDLGPGSRHFVDWLATARQGLWQVLPLTPIGPGNSPYASVSAFAGNPLLIALEPLVEAGWLDAEALVEVPTFDPGQIDFATVPDWRIARLRRAEAGFLAHAGAPDRAAFAAFRTRAASWLDDYTLFMALDQAAQARHPGARWTAWPAELAGRAPAALAHARQEHAAETGFWAFVQWCFDTQWSALRAYATARGIGLVGDLPIFVAHHSADCWAHPDLFLLDARGEPTAVAGVPPDFFSATGQHWGNPLYDWERCAAQGYAWWIARMRRQLEQCDLVRIDHFRGFAAYWSIPADAPNAMSGHWKPGPGAALFQAMAAALGPLPIIAEDLGVITPDVSELRDGLGFPGMRILQFAFGGAADHAYLPHNYPSNAVAYTGTHDNDTLQGWWAAAGAAERDHALRYLGPAEEPLHWRALRMVSASAASTVIFPLQDVLGLDSRHRLNTPGELGCWSWRFQWDWVAPDAARKLADISALYGRASSAR